MLILFIYICALCILNLSVINILFQCIIDLILVVRLLFCLKRSYYPRLTSLLRSPLMGADSHYLHFKI